MPTQPRIKKEQIVQAAIELARHGGIDAVTTTALCDKLKCTLPALYYKKFDSVEQIRLAVMDEAVKVYRAYQLENVRPEFGKFKATGMNYIHFAIDEPHLFRLLFMSDRKMDVNLTNSNLDYNREQNVQQLQELYNLSDEDANDAFTKIWVFCHGMATLFVTNTVTLDPDEISRMGTEVLTAIIRNLKG